jgi:hypothetical protein
MPPISMAEPTGRYLTSEEREENYVVIADAHPELEGRTTADLTVAVAGEASDAGGCCAGSAADSDEAVTAGACCAG